MSTIQSITRIFCILLVAVFMLGITPAQAQTASASAGLSPADWTQINALMPAAGPDAQQAYIKASNTGGGMLYTTQNGDSFGVAIALSGDTLAVGARYEASSATGIDGDQVDNSTDDSGAVYVFTRSGAVWSQQAYIKASNTGENDGFGTALAIEGDTLVVGAPFEDSAATGVDGDQADNTAYDSGAAYIFTRSGATWSQQAYLKASNTGGGDTVNWESGDMFGSSVAISGDTILVGAPSEDSNATDVGGNQGNDSAPGSGAAYVFTRSGSVWSQQAYVKASNTGADDYFGVSVAISGETLVVGANGESSNATGINGNQADNSAYTSGAAYVFTRAGSAWSQQAYLKASNTEGGNASNAENGDMFGGSVTISGDTLVVGASYEDSYAIGVNGNQANNSAYDSGAAYVFTRSGSNWSQQAYLKASNTGGGDSFNSTHGDMFASSIALSDETLLIGAPYEDSQATGVNGDQADDYWSGDSGAAYVFARNGGVWSQQAYLKASNTQQFGASTDSNDSFGAAVALSGETLVAGAPYEDSNATGIGGDQQNDNALDSGAAYVFDLPPLVVSSLRTDANPTHAASLNFTVTFSQAMTGVDLDDFALTAGDVNGETVTGASITNVSGGPTTYTVSVNTGSGNGTLRLDLVDDESIASVATSEPLGGAGPENGDFTQGEFYTIDKTPPTVFSMVRANSDPTRAASVDFTLTFSEAVTGVDATDFLPTTDLTGVSITNVSGSDDTYTITASTGTGGGSLRIDLINNGSIKDLATNNMPAGDFTSGDTYTVNRSDNAFPLDTTFGVHGIVATDGGSRNGVSAVAIQPDGKIVMIGYRENAYGTNFLLERYNLNGLLDETFGYGGFMETYLSNYAYGDALAIQPDGKIIASGSTDFGVTLVRYKPNGSLDTTFGSGGKVTTQNTGFNSSVVLQPNGQILVAGNYTQDFVVARYNSNGSLDTSFGTHGKTLTDFGGTTDNSSAMLLQPDGKIIVAGNNSYKGFALVRYNTNGSLDTSFGNHGKLTTQINQGSTADDLALQPDGKIIVSGTDGANGLVVLARYNTNGSLDTTFGAGGMITTKIGATMDANNLVVQPDGRMMVSGYSYNGSSPDAFVLTRYKANGVLDTTFGVDGVVITDIGDTSAVADMAFQPNGKLILAGDSTTTGNDAFALARYTVDYLILPSNPSQDGWVLESSENSGAGSTIDSAAATFNLGDNAANKQYRGILSFSTGAALPNTAIITSVTLKVKKSTAVDPVSMFKGFMVDIKKGAFGTATLQADDFQAAANATYGPFVFAPVDGWYRINLTGAKAYVNKLPTASGLTQIRLRFKLDDNNNAIANLLSLYSGNAPAVNRPQLVITYYVP